MEAFCSVNMSVHFSTSKDVRCLNSSDDVYQQMKGNINLTKCIQLGFALCNEQGVPSYEDKNPCIRDFNLKVYTYSSRDGELTERRSTNGPCTYVCCNLDTW